MRPKNPAWRCKILVTIMARLFCALHLLARSTEHEGRISRTDRKARSARDRAHRGTRRRFHRRDLRKLAGPPTANMYRMDGVQVPKVEALAGGAPLVFTRYARTSDP